jgi:hypothetical protein
MPTMGTVPVGAQGAVEGGVAEGEHPAVGGDEPVPLAVRSGGRADDVFVEVDRTEGAVEGGVAEGEHPAVGRRSTTPVPPSQLGRAS